ncbi:hypothetical protein C8A00DRAFT_29563 [Chaetomidium leptoderma]|uniref:3-carboxymuconate cyclase n=1 Tax=Chaetomidium leptoderma TaxID=669021 RepID=A0AAN6VW07_9PEZI|nr:hypothetical protein C8A00DRAFT_29563 [Chaetomidium leptoderma]
MSFTPRSCLLLAALLSLAPGVISVPSSKFPRHGGNTAVGKAVYFITNDKANAVVALPIGADGKLSRGTVTSTGGAGSIALNSDNQPATPDALVSQSALTIAGDAIFAVNAGSNTLSMLSISPSHPTKLSLVGQPVKIPGEFANTVAASAKNGVVCVGTSGARAGVACSPFSARHGLGPMDALRPFDLGQTTPPVGPTNTVSQVFFSADEAMLFATVKGDPGANKTGFFSAFPVQKKAGGCSSSSSPRAAGAGGGKAAGRMSVSSVEQRSVPDGSAVLFGSQAIPGTNNVFATDAAFGAVILAVDPASGRATTLAKVELPGQAATCWATISPATGTAFVTDVAVNRMVEMSVADASIIAELDLSANGDPGLTDLRAAGNFIYALSPGNGKTEGAVTVVDVSGGSGSAAMVQHFGLKGVAGQTATGMTVLI